jgi:uncharacterized oxidoreductase
MTKYKCSMLVTLLRPLESFSWWMRYRAQLSQQTMKPTDNIILITGGATGIGFAMSERLISSGNTVITCGRNQDALRLATTALPKLITRHCDLTNDADRTDLVAWLLDCFPSFNVLINNAGIQRSIDFTASVADVRSVTAEITTNLTVPILLTSALLPHLRSQASSTVINVSSGLAFCPIAGIPVYCATKAALHSFTLSLRHQLRHSNIGIVEFVPPIVDTALDTSDRRDSEDSSRSISAAEFADEALLRLAQGETEIVIGIANGLRQQGESMFNVLNE